MDSIDGVLQILAYEGGGLGALAAALTWLAISFVVSLVCARSLLGSIAIFVVMVWGAGSFVPDLARSCLRCRGKTWKVRA
jgi:hypothetical protein